MPLHTELLKYCIQYRLEMVTPYIQSGRWSEGMALGATPYNAMSTATNLEEIVNIIEEELMKASSQENNTIGRKLNPLERTAIGGVYVITELHLLADTSSQYQDTWTFLNDRVNELDMIQRQKSIMSLNPDTFIAGSAVAASMGTAVLSLMTPIARNGVNAMAGTIIPQVMNAMSNVSTTINIGASKPPGTAAKDYDFSDLPPFEGEEEVVQKKQ